MEVDFNKKIANDPDFAEYHQVPEEPKSSRRFFYVVGFLVAAIIIFSATMLMSSDSRESWLGHIPFLGKLLAASNNELLGEKEDRINILLLGMGGENHDGGYLADTIMLASLEPSTKKVALISIPRDLTVPDSNGVWQKVNSINAYAEAKKEDGSQATVDALSSLLDIPIQYYVRVDFDGFISIIDELGGITVDVENTLDDYSYPIRGREDNPDYYSRYEHLHIDKGLQEMDGSLALKYARSRHGVGLEGSDFARSKRQKKILSAVRNELMSSSNILKPGMLTRIAGQVLEHTATNLKIWEGLRLWDLFKDTPQEQINSIGLDDGPGGLLVSSRGVDGAYILVPIGGNFEKIKTMVNDVFGQMPETKSAPKELEISSEPATIEIRNGTNISGLASEVSTRLEATNIKTIRTANSTKRDLKDAVIYDLTYGAKPQALEALKNNTNAVIGLELPEWLVADIKEGLKNNPKQARPDFILIVGTNNHQL
ncbi:MAG: LCP family protein [Patescibacteria group bacterium]|jgi:LCP family protein required for cell wall assembly